MRNLRAQIAPPPCRYDAAWLLPLDVAYVRGETIAAEDIMHDIGAISAMSSDSQAMGRVGEVITRTWQTADKV